MNTGEGDAENSKIAKEKSNYICDICNRSFKLLNGFKRHQNNHPPENYKCTICGNTFKDKYSMLRHQSYHGPRTFYNCDVCDKSYLTLKTFQDHKLLHVAETMASSGGIFKCSDCGFEFKSANSLKMHWISKHTTRKSTKRECNICGKILSDLSALKTHRFVHSGEKTLECDVCGKGFTEMRRLKKHLSIHTGDIQYKCDVCGIGFIDHRELKAHHHEFKTHIVEHTTDKKQFQCDSCNKKFTRKHDLFRHKIRHTNELKHKCDVCGKNFLDVPTLNRHQRIHSNERPYVCKLCDKGFNDPSTLRQHYQRVHGVQQSQFSY